MLMIGTLAPNSRLVRKTYRSQSNGKSALDSSPLAIAPVTFGSDAMLASRDRLYTEFTPLVRRLIRQYGKSAEMREDLTGEIYCRFCALLEAFDPSRGIPLRPYLVRQLTLATHTYARQQWRIQSREATGEFLESRAEQGSAFDPTVDWLAALVKSEAAALLPAAIENLPPRQRNIVIARYFYDQPFEEIAERLGIQASTVRSQLRHAINNLRKAIEPESSGLA